MSDLSPLWPLHSDDDHPIPGDPPQGMAVQVHEEDPYRPAEFSLLVWRNYSPNTGEFDAEVHYFRVLVQDRMILRERSSVHRGLGPWQGQYHVPLTETVRRKLSEIAKTLWPDLKRFSGLRW